MARWASVAPVNSDSPETPYTEGIGGDGGSARSFARSIPCKFLVKPKDALVVGSFFFRITLCGGAVH